MKKQTKQERAKELEALRNNPVNLFLCQSCKDREAESFDSFVNHCKEVHKTDIKGAKGKKQMMAHIDYDDRFSSTYQWTLETGLQFQQYVEIARDKHTMLY